jgi:hypothetical protein
VGNNLRVVACPRVDVVGVRDDAWLRWDPAAAGVAASRASTAVKTPRYTGRAETRGCLSSERLGARSDFDEWADAVVAALKKHRLRAGAAPGGLGAQDRAGLRRWVSRMLTKIAA